MMRKQNKNITSPPYIHNWKTTSNVTWICIISIIAIMAWSSFLYGYMALRICFSAVISAVAAELIVSAFTKKWTLTDGSAILTGLLIASAMPPSISWYIPSIASLFAIFVVKATFGGLGTNWMNPAMAGVAFAYTNWPNEMREFVLPKIISGVDGISAATPTNFARGITGVMDKNITEILHTVSYPLSNLDQIITSFFNTTLFSKLSASLPSGYIDMLIGYKPSTLGESSVFIVLLASIALLGLKLIKPHISISILTTFAVLVFLFGTGLPHESLFKGDILFAMLSGNIFFVAFFVASDPVTSPITKFSGILYGIGIALICFLFRKLGSYTDGAAYAILLMNIFTPALDKLGLRVFNGRRLA